MLGPNPVIAGIGCPFFYMMTKRHAVTKKAKSTGTPARDRKQKQSTLGRPPAEPGPAEFPPLFALDVEATSPEMPPGHFRVLFDSRVERRAQEVEVRAQFQKMDVYPGLYVHFPTCKQLAFASPPSGELFVSLVVALPPRAPSGPAPKSGVPGRKRNRRGKR